MKIVATLSLPAVDRPNADRWNAARSRQNDIRNSCHKEEEDTFNDKIISIFLDI